MLSREGIIIENFFMIPDKAGNDVPFVLNPAQRRYDQEKTNYDLIPKARQEGISSYKLAELTVKCLYKRNTRAVVISHDQESTERLFKRVHYFIDNFRGPAKPKKLGQGSKREIVFPKTNSTFYIGTAGSRKFGRGDTITDLHCCIHPDTEVLWNHGFPVPISLAGYHTANFDGNMVSIKCWLNKDTICVTPEHKVMTQRGMIPASEVCCTDYIAFEVRNITDTYRYVTVPVRYRNRTDVMYIPADEDFGFIIGLYAAEGSVNKNRIMFTLHEEESLLIDKIFRFFNKYSLKTIGRADRKEAHPMGEPVIRTRDSKAISVEINSRTWADFFRNNFYYNPEGEFNCYFKVIPDKVFECGRDFCKGIVYGYIAGDGHIDIKGRVIRVSSYRPSLIYQLRDLVASLGYGFGSISFNNNEWQGTYVYSATGYTYTKLSPFGCEVLDRTERATKWYQHENYIFCKVADIKSVPYKGKVYDLINQPDHLVRLCGGLVSNSEAAFWEDPKTLFSGLSDAVPINTGTITLESTGNGHNWYYQRVKDALDGRSHYKIHFFNWQDFPEYDLEVSEEEKEHILATLDPEYEEDRLWNEGILTIGQLKFRRLKLAEKDWDLQLFKQEYPMSLDECFQSTSTGLFSKVLYDPNYKYWQVVYKTGVQSLHADVNHPMPGYHYVLGLDPSEGVGNDNAVIEVICLETGNQVAEWVSGHLEQDVQAEKLLELGYLYNTGFLVVERNKGMVALKVIRDSNYPSHLIYREKPSPTEPLMKMGFNTTAKSKRPLIIGLLRMYLRDSMTIYSESLKSELDTFKEHESGKLEAEQGAKDDRVMALAMCVAGFQKAALYMGDTRHVDMIPVEIADPFCLESIIKELSSRSNHGFPIRSYARIN